jgi:precorrin-6Y C5,15-methyltransferase (decarboxylating) CbiT subunit
MWNKQVQGIPDEFFIRGDIPMTKSEVRAITLSKLQLKKDAYLLDIGCGTGSVSVESGFIATEGKIIAVDEKVEAINLTKANAKQFDLHNITTIQGTAPEILPDQDFDQIFLGGGSNRLNSIMDYVNEHLKPKGRFVANTILINSTYELLHLLEAYKFKNIECVQIQISRGHHHSVGWMMKALNPIYIISAEKGDNLK